MRALVTGGAGFIGSNLVDYLIEQGHDVVVIDDLSSGKRENVNPKATLYEKDISSPLPKLLSYFYKVDTVFHLAAWPRVPRSIKDPLGTNRVNVIGTLNVLQACRQLMIKRLIYSSSSSVYGNQGEAQMNEDMIPSPISPYGLQKLIGEQYATVFARLFDMSITSLRYFNVYGPRQLMEGAYSLVIGKFIDLKRQGKKLTVYGDGTQTRAYTHVSDVVHANYLVATSPELKGHNIFNVGTDKETSVNQIANLVGGEVKHIIPNPRGDFEEERKSADFLKIKEYYGWEPKVKIEDGIKELL